MTPSLTIDTFSKTWTPEPYSGCWLWKRSRTDERGYGQVYYKGKRTTAHRFSWMLFKGQIPRGLCVLHSCDTPCCVNPSHLFLGTNADNNMDKARKLRGRVNKLTVSQIREIRTSPENGQSLSRRFGVWSSTISNIRTHKTWKHIN